MVLGGRDPRAGRPWLISRDIAPRLRPRIIRGVESPCSTKTSLSPSGRLFRLVPLLDHRHWVPVEPVRAALMISPGRLREAQSPGSEVPITKEPPCGAALNGPAPAPCPQLHALNSPSALGNHPARRIHGVAQGVAARQQGGGKGRDEQQGDRSLHRIPPLVLVSGFIRRATRSRASENARFGSGNPRPRGHRATAADSRSTSGPTVASSNANRIPAAENNPGSGRELPSARPSR